MNNKQKFSAINLSASRGGRTIFENLSFAVTSGNVLKITGRNGAGKSTLLKCIMGLIKPSAGDISLNNTSITSDHEWKSQSLCYLGHKNALKKEFTVIENIEFWAKMWKSEDKISSSLKQLGIEYLSDTPVRYLSSGQARRTALARNLCHPGLVWLFDEPTVGLDEEGLLLLSKAMNNHIEAGGIILCATHVELGLSQKNIVTLNLSDFTPKYDRSDADFW